MNPSIPVVVIIGRPNVGKSSLFNRLVGRRKSIVEEASGTTRDRLHVQIQRDGVRFEFVDTGGIELEAKAPITKEVKRQALDAVKIADVLIFVVDATTGVVDLDCEIAKGVRQSGKKVVLVVNKTDSAELKIQACTFHRLGLGDPVCISALHNDGIQDLVDQVLAALKDRVCIASSSVSVSSSIHIACVGKPNAGKSSFVNALLQKERVIVDTVPGTTRDSIDTLFEKDSVLYEITDTAGLKHNRKVKEVVEVFSHARSKESIRHAHIVVHFVDAVAGLSTDDLAILNYSIEYGKGIVLAINKWDLVHNITPEAYRASLEKAVPSSSWIPMVFISCKTGKNILKVIDTAHQVYQRMNTSYGTHDLNTLLHRIEKGPSRFFYRRSQIRALYITQKSTFPLVFIVFTNLTPIPAYIRYVENVLRNSLHLEGVPLKIEIRAKNKKIASQ